MSTQYTGEPVSWLRLERYHLGELGAAEAARVAEHLAACPTCAACLARIREEAGATLPALVLADPARGARKRAVAWARGAGIASVALAAAAGFVFALRSAAGPEATALHRPPGIATKGNVVAFSLVPDRGDRIDDDFGTYRDAERFKALVTCTPGVERAFDLVVYDEGGASFPLEQAGAFACGNDVPLPGAFRLTGHGHEEVCLVWNDGDAVDRRLLMRAEPAAHRLCKRLTPRDP